MAETRGICFCLKEIKPGEDTASMLCGCGGMHAACMRQWKDSHLSLIQEHWTGPGPDPPVSILPEDVPCPYCKVTGRELMAIEAWTYELRLFLKEEIDGPGATEALCHVRNKFSHKICIDEIVGVQKNMATGKERPVRAVEH